jgi:hypothetical protein
MGQRVGGVAGLLEELTDGIATANAAPEKLDHGVPPSIVHGKKFAKAVPFSMEFVCGVL